MILEQRNGDPNDKFPVGMRVLAVDDDPLCLKLLDTLLRKCQYHVTTTGQAVQALKLLREKRDQFDLVISDVQMPDMDGFKLLELVGLEMDLPVIMLSSYGDTKLVMKGITHGACDYLLKPVRIEELKNIWQHVVRKKKRDPRDRNNSYNQENKLSGAAEGNGSSGTSSYDQDGNIGRKRKDQIEEEDEENDDSGNDNDDPSAQKKPRVVWSVDLHRKFVAAVNQLGLDKAVPKKILELMNVDKLTRENVASHLQKYRLYLRRIHTVANQQANFVAALGGTDSAYLRMASVNFPNFNNSVQFQATPLRSIPRPTGALNRLNTPASLGSLHGLSASSMVPLGHAQIPSYSADDCTKLSGFLPGDQTGNILQGMPASFEFDQVKHKKGISGGVGDFSMANDNAVIFPISSVNTIVGGSNNSLLSIPNGSVVLQGQSNEAQSQGAFGNRSSFGPVSLNTDPSINLLEDGNVNSGWASTVTASGVQSASLSSNDYYEPNAANPRGNATLALCGAVELQSIPSNIPLPPQSQDSRLDVQGQAALLSDNAAEGLRYGPKQAWESQKLDALRHSNMINAPLNSPIAAQGTGSFPFGSGFNRNVECGVSEQLGMGALAVQQIGVGSSSMQAATTTLKQRYPMDHGRSLGGYPIRDAGSLEDVVSAMIKRDPDAKERWGACI